MLFCSVEQSNAINVAIYGDAEKESEIIERTFGKDNIQYYQIESPVQLIDFVNSGQADIGIGNLTISKDRYQLVDFSFPYYSVDTKVLAKIDSGVIGLIKNNIKNLILLFSVVFIFANLIWLIERGNGIISKRYYNGIFDSIYYCFIILTSVGFEDYIRKKITRIFVIILMLFGMGFYAVAVSELTNSQYIDKEVRQISDLNGLTVGTYQNTFTQSWLEKQKFDVFPIDKSDKLDFTQYDVFVYDEPYLRSLQDRNTKMFDVSLFRQYYGIVFNKDKTELKERINKEILVHIE